MNTTNIICNEGVINLASGILAQAKDDYLMSLILADSELVDVKGPYKDLDTYSSELVSELKETKNKVKATLIREELREWRRMKREDPAEAAQIIRDSLKAFFYDDEFQIYSMGIDPDAAIQVMNRELPTYYNKFVEAQEKMVKKRKNFVPKKLRPLNVVLAECK